MARILLTGGRAPVALELARLFHRAGQTVLVAESVPWPMCRGSKAVAGCFHVPPPNLRPQVFIDALAAVIRRERIDWLIPTCEETLFVAWGKPRLKPLCRVFTDSFEVLHSLHSKWQFIELARSFGLPAPPTELVTTSAQAARLIAASRRLVLKPVYSRFGTQTLIRPTRPPHIEPGRPWVAQQILPGRQLCTFSVAHAGRLVAHSTYAIKFTAGRGAAIHFKAEDHPPAFEWVRQFVAQTRFSGQIAFDFIETGPGQVAAIECNPRATSGLHLFGPELAGAYFNPNRPLLTPPPGQSAKLTAALLLYAPFNIRRHGWQSWLAALAGGREVVFNWRDPWPGLVSQWVGLAWFLGQSARRRVSPTAATTLDIEWNGETMSN